ncbi:hypothetical protein [Marinimicrococcus flavescens]|uniref:Uncharacterized protein n=1 Tax=Marinimicrococcus flavescens TaxID=3031815 RepID=A0AAP3UYK3_9PROT|nr:hypothetical protein [Marinimicrococcus flavescens]
MLVLLAAACAGPPERPLQAVPEAVPEARRGAVPARLAARRNLVRGGAYRAYPPAP